MGTLNIEHPPWQHPGILYNKLTSFKRPQENIEVFLESLATTVTGITANFGVFSLNRNITELLHKLKYIKKKKSQT